ncbi:hypothetical protein Ciccas_001165 [Cichlidogyrus casuarinus]|uniref:Maturase K n=1 Tax=Cichlidogyrus casuarinus TaxID=1844966 RepID=A0ABD2QKY1_9PLAT
MNEYGVSLSQTNSVQFFKQCNFIFFLNILRLLTTKLRSQSGSGGFLPFLDEQLKLMISNHPLTSLLGKSCVLNEVYLKLTFKRRFCVVMAYILRSISGKGQRAFSD